MSHPNRITPIDLHGTRYSVTRTAAGALVSIDRMPEPGRRGASRRALRIAIDGPTAAAVLAAEEAWHRSSAAWPRP